MEARFQQKMSALLGEQWPQKPLLLAVSGGIDSMSLLHLLRFHPHLTVAHFNHSTRGEESNQDEKLIRDYCQAHSFHFISAYRQGNNLSEESLRRERHSFLNRVRIETQSEWILTAHHLEDQFETFQMRLIRGSGLTGLQGMKGLSYPYARPLLQFTREEIEQYTRIHNIPYREDSSNRSLHYFRNRIRQQLTPLWMEVGRDFGNKADHLKRFQHLQEELSEYESLKQEKVQQLKIALVIETPFWWKIDEKGFRSLNPFERSLLIRSYYAENGIYPFPLREQLTTLEQRLILSKGEIPCPSGVHLGLSCGQFFLSHQKLEEPQLNEGIWNLNGIPLLKLQSDQKLKLRNFRHGDQFKNKKLKEWFLDFRIPKWERPLIPIHMNEKDQPHWFFPLPSDSIQIQEIYYPFNLPMVEELRPSE